MYFRLIYAALLMLSTARVPLPVNGEYLLFIQKHDGRDEAGLEIFVDNCGNSTAMAFASRLRPEMIALAKRSK